MKKCTKYTPDIIQLKYMRAILPNIVFYNPIILYKILIRG